MVVFSFERSGFGLRVTRVSIFETKLFTRRVKVLFLLPPPPLNFDSIERSENREHASVRLLHVCRESPVVWKWYRGKRAHSLNGTMHSPWLGIVTAYESLRALSLSLFHSNRYPLSDCLGIVTSVQSAARSARRFVRDLTRGESHCNNYSLQGHECAPFVHRPG